MTEVRSWLGQRHPPPPPELRSAIVSAADEAAPAPPASVQDVLRDATRTCLDAALAEPGRVRESAFRLLTADALLTYACEAALGSDEPEASLASLVADLLPPDGVR